MRRALRRAAQAFAAAGALGLVRPAGAQPAPEVHAGAAPAGAVAPEGGAPLPAGNGRLEEMKVELAWLADLMTFSYRLGARFTGSALEARGYVPNEMVKEHALQVARRHSFLPVVDSLKVHPQLATRSIGAPIEALQLGATEVLVEALGEPARSFGIKARINGQVIVTGSCGSVEEKLAVSRLLRLLSGCGCVANHLTVTPVQRDGQAVTLITADGTYAVPGKVTDLDEAGPGTRATTLQPQVVETAPLPAPLPPAPTPLPGPAAASPPATPRPAVAQPEEIALPRILQGPSPSMTPAPTIIAPAAPRPATLPAVPLTPTLPPAAPAPGTQGALPARTNAPAPVIVSSTPPPLPTIISQPAPARAGATGKNAPLDLLSVPSVPPAWSGSAPAPVTSAPRAEPAGIRPVTTSHPAPARAEASRKKSGDLFAVQPEPVVPANHRPPAHHDEGKTAAYATSGVVVFDEDPRSPDSPASMPIVPAQLRQRVQMVCGSQARDVQVMVHPDGAVRVKVNVANAEVRRQLMAKILQLPEMSSPAVHLEMEVLP